MRIPKQRNQQTIVLTIYHRNPFGTADQFLGTASIPLDSFDPEAAPKTDWYPLKCKPGQAKTDYRGELQVRVGFTVKIVNDGSQSLAGSTSNLCNNTKLNLWLYCV